MPARQTHRGKTFLPLANSYGLDHACARFVPFSLEAGGVWGPAARKFFRTCTAVAGGDRGIDLYHWSTPRFSSVWQDTLSVLVARGRARVSVSASAADWPKRIRDMQYVAAAH
eukprot:COSAG06_NODE_1952_length_7992_cov_4.274294_11_plen_113_part_00